MPNEASRQIEIIQQLNPGAVVSGRGKRRLDFDFLNGRKGQLLSLGSWHYGPNNDQEIDTDWAASAVQPWLWQMVKADFNVYAMPGNASFNAGQIIKYVHPESGSEITFQPQQLQWTNDLDQISAVADVADVAGVVSENIITWPGAYGADTSFDWAVQADRLQKRLTINSLAAPPAFIIAGGNPVLRTQFIIGKSSNVAIWIDGVRHDEKNKTQIDSVNAIEFRDTATQTVLWYFESASAWDSRTTNEKNVPTVATRVRSTNQSVFIEILTPWSWLETAVFPITIDPSITPQVAADAADGLTYSGSGFSTSYNQWFIGNDGDTLWPFAYIAGVTIPDGATIDTSYLIIVAASTKSGTTVNTRIQFEDAANPTAPTSYATWAARTLTTTYVDWNSIAAWTNGVTYNSPEIKTIIQELVDSYDYSSGATMGVLGQYIAATSYRHGTDYHGSSANAVKLYIEYTEAGGGTEYPIEPTAGSYAITGKSLTVTATRPAALTAGSFTITGQSLTAVATRPVLFGAGAYSLTGNSIAVSVIRAVTLGVGSYTIGGQSVTAAAARIVTLSAGGYSVSGQSVTVTVSRVVGLAAGSYAISGNDLTAVVARTVTLGAGSYTLSGQSITAVFTRVVTLEIGSYTITGQTIDASPPGTVQYPVDFTLSTYTLTGQSITVVISRPVSFEVGVYSIGGQSINAIVSRPIALGAGGYTISGGALTAVVSRPATLGVGSYALTGAAIGVTMSRLVELAIGAYILTGRSIVVTVPGDVGDATASDSDYYGASISNSAYYGASISDSDYYGALAEDSNG